MHKISIVILAAGGSTRMGQPKQLLEINGKTLIRKTAELANDLSPAQTIVVLGKASSQIEKAIADLPVQIAKNPNWQSGMASSLAVGIAALQIAERDFDAVLLLLCDQPLVTLDYLKRLAQAYRSEALPAVASAYNNILGVPAIFDWERLQRFVNEEGDHGARYLLKSLAEQQHVRSLNFPEGAIDLDTPAAYQAFLEQYSKVDLKNKKPL